MFGKLLVSTGLVGALALSAAADRPGEKGDVLAWTVAAYASCETIDMLQRDYREEVARIEATTDELLYSLRVLSEADSVCGNLNTYATEMLALAETDLAAVEARLMEFEEQQFAEFEEEVPKGNGSDEFERNLILTESSNPPPVSGPMPPSSDYQN